jgi:hypothetical protein
MTDQPRNWDKELADIDRVIEKEAGVPGGQRGATPALPPGPVGPAGLPAGAPAPPAPAAPKRSVAMTWFWVVLAVLLAVGLPLWPYGTECGLQLFFYLGAVTLALLAGGAGAVSSWATRRGLAHVLSLLVVLWAGVMGAREILPRTNYAAQSKAWLCPATPEPATPEPATPLPGTGSAPSAAGE